MAVLHELSRTFVFEAAHTLVREIDAERSRRIHGHSYRAEVVLRGTPDPGTGMLVDLAAFQQALDEVRDQLDHRFLDEVEGLGPATLENLCSFLWRRLEGKLPGLCRVRVSRELTGDACSLCC